MLDTSIITNGTLNAQAQQARNMEALGNLGGAFGRILLAHKINDMNQLGADEQKVYAQKSKLFAPQLMQQYNDNRQSEQKAIRDQLKFDADLDKTYADTAQTYALGRKNDADAGKSTAEGKKVGAETTGLTIDQDTKLNSMVWGSVLHGGKNAGIAQLEMQKSRGLIDEATYNQRLGFINNLPVNPQQAQQYAFAMYKGIQDPKYSLTTADNVLDNQTSSDNNIRDNTTSTNNNIRTTQASMYSSDNTLRGVQYTADQATERNTAEIEYKRQKDAIESKQGEYKSWNGQVYFVDKSGAVFDAIDAQGNKIMDNSTAPGVKGANSQQTKQNEETLRTQRVGVVLDDIEKILPNATGSWLGTGVDWAAGAFGHATDGAKATAQLKSLGGQLVALMPKMSGPQSDKDVAMYKEMAGNLSDQTLPIATRMAALQTIRQLNNKYAAMNDGGYPAVSAPPASIAKPTGKAKPPLAAYGL